MKSVEKDKKKLEDCLDSLEEADGVTIFLPENEKDVTGKIVH